MKKLLSATTLLIGLFAVTTHSLASSADGYNDMPFSTKHCVSKITSHGEYYRYLNGVLQLERSKLGLLAGYEDKEIIVTFENTESLKLISIEESTYDKNQRSHCRSGSARTNEVIQGHLAGVPIQIEMECMRELYPDGGSDSEGNYCY